MPASAGAGIAASSREMMNLLGDIIGSTRLARRAGIEQVRKAIEREREGDRTGGAEATKKAFQQAAPVTAVNLPLPAGLSFPGV